MPRHYRVHLKVNQLCLVPEAIDPGPGLFLGLGLFAMLILVAIFIFMAGPAGAFVFIAMLGEE